MNLVLRLFLRSPFIVFGAMIMAFTVDVKAALVFVVTIPLLSLIVFGIMLVTMPMYKKVQADLDQVLLATRENLTGARVIRAFNKEEDETKRFENANQILTDAQKYVGRISGMMNPLTYIIVEKVSGYKERRLCNHRDGIIYDVCSKISVGVIHKAVEYIADTALFLSCHIKVETYESHLQHADHDR